MADSCTRRLKRSRAWHRARWREHVATQEGSGLSAAAYCQEHGLRPRSFYRWRGVFRAEDVAGNVPASADSQAGTSAPSRAVFAELRLPTGAGEAASGIEVLLAGERRLRLGPGFDEETLRRAVSVLESLSC